jgi:hypothetical protein
MQWIKKFEIAEKYSKLSDNSMLKENGICHMKKIKSEDRP